MRWLFVLTLLGLMLVFGAFTWADCTQSILCCGGPPPPSGPTPTPDPYAWIGNLPLCGRKPTWYGDWSNSGSR